MLLLRSRRRRGWWGRGVSLDGWGWVVIVILWFGLWLLVVPRLRAFLFGFLRRERVRMEGFWVEMGPGVIGRGVRHVIDVLDGFSRARNSEYH